MIVFISDFDMRGSGYMGIAISLCNQLATKHKKNVMALGITYNMAEHNWPFSIIPVDPNDYPRHIPAMIHNFNYLAGSKRWERIEAIVVALDLPVQEKLLTMERGPAPYIGIFPVESGPLCKSWTMALTRMNEKLVISEFGARMISDTGIEATYLPVGLDAKSWRRPEAREREAIRKSLGIRDDEFIVLTVGDNQERKNLSGAAQAISILRRKVNAKWMLVSRINSSVGWRLDDMVESYGLSSAFSKFDKGLPFDRLWFLYAAADAFLLTSKAEGLCLPILEAMACGVPVVATECTAIPEHLYEDPDWSRIENGLWRKGRPKGPRGFAVPGIFNFMDPWGNSMRTFVDPKLAARSLEKIAKAGRVRLEPMLSSAQSYASSRTWERAGDVLAESINRAVLESPPVPEEQPNIPASVPRPVPRLELSDEQ